ncbi:MAG: SRPBCC domain-containing protein [Ornithinimicrobium sp.]
MNTITMTRTVQARLERAYAAWTDAELLATWWWPHLPDTSYQVDARVGGNYTIYSATASIGVQGEFLVMDPPTLLRFTWVWLTDGQAAVVEGTPVVDRVEVSFADLGEQTEVTVRHTSSEDLVNGGAQQGWNDCLDRLTRFT